MLRALAHLLLASVGLAALLVLLAVMSHGLTTAAQVMP